MLSIIWLKAINDCLFYQLCDWRRSMITSFINYMYGGETLIASFISAMFEGDHSPLLWWMITYKRAKRSLSTFFLSWHGWERMGISTVSISTIRPPQHMWAVERYSRELCHQPRSGCCWHHVLEPEYPKESSWKWPDNNQRPPWVLLQQCFSSLSPGRTCRCWLSSVCYHSYMNGVCAGGSWSISAKVTRAINAIALLCMHCYGNDRRSLITSFSIMKVFTDHF